jgi:hypothetical protein
MYLEVPVPREAGEGETGNRSSDWPGPCRERPGTPFGQQRGSRGVYELVLVCWNNTFQQTSIQWCTLVRACCGDNLRNMLTHQRCFLDQDPCPDRCAREQFDDILHSWGGLRAAVCVWLEWPCFCQNSTYQENCLCNSVGYQVSILDGCTGDWHPSNAGYP